MQYNGTLKQHLMLAANILDERGEINARTRGYESTLRVKCYRHIKYLNSEYVYVAECRCSTLNWQVGKAEWSKLLPPVRGVVGSILGHDIL